MRTIDSLAGVLQRHMVLLGAAAVATPTIAAVTSVEVHWDITTIAVALITGLFGTIQIYMLKSLHTMVNSQQSALNEIARRDAINAGYEAGKNAGGSQAREKAAVDALATADQVEATPHEATIPKK